MSLTDVELEELLSAGAVKLEVTSGIPTWEASPSIRHQRTIARIEASIQPLTDNDGSCECAHYQDVYIRFPDGSIKRPDIAIFCEEPPDQDDALTIVPQAVIEVISPGYEYKDVELNPRFYLSQGVEDILIVDPRTGIVTHYREARVDTYNAPIKVELQCGCQCTVPQVGEAGERRGEERRGEERGYCEALFG